MSSRRINLAAVIALQFAGAHGFAQDGSGQRRTSQVGRFEFNLAAAATTSGGVYDPTGRLVRPLWAVKALAPGTHRGSWDGLDQHGLPAPKGEYELRIVVNNSTYQNVGIIGNDGAGRADHTPGTLVSIAVDPLGATYTANGWEEAGADFKKWDREGRSVYDADFQVRNGEPNGTAYAIAVDESYLYCAVGGWDRAPFNSRQQVQRFRSRDGRAEPFPAARENGGHLQLHEWPERKIPAATPPRDAALMRQPLRALAVGGDRLLVCDALEGRVHAFDRRTGRRGPSVPIPLPAAVAVGSDGQVWVGHEHSRISTIAADGNVRRRIEGLGEVKGLALGPDERLYVADSGAGSVRVYDVRGASPKSLGSFGTRARPGDHAPDRFYDLTGVAADRRGDLITIQNLPLGGARLARWSPGRTLRWERQGLEFVSLGTYSVRSPDEFLSLQANRYHLRRGGHPSWTFRGNLFEGDRRYRADVHGVPRLVTLAGAEFFYTAQGDGVQVFRRERDSLRPAARIGGRWPDPAGKDDRKGPLGQWTWSDGDGDGVVDPAEVRWFKPPGSGKYSTFGFNVDDHGNLLYCDQETGTIQELPLAGRDPRGNPLYDWARSRRIVPRDTSRARLTPLMAVRSAEGELYAFGRSETWKEPRNSGAWMGGWALSRYDPRGRLLWATPLPEVCVGIDAIPGGGVLLAWYEKGHLYHYNADGLHIGTAVPGAASGGATGWLDNTAALAVNRDPRDRILDAFTSDNLLYRILWYRIDDRAIETLRTPVRL